jgi:ATP-binding cassette, subfamily C (CFTR/MRP), member 1
VRLDMIGAVMVLTVTVCILWFQDSISETLAALALSYSTQLQSRLTECVWKSIETENYMTQMERLEHFQHIPQESHDEGDDVPANWPKHGKVMFDRVHFRYRPDLSNVLHGVNFLVQPSEHLGICGRTGSGKSSLMVVMFRLGEIAQGQGNIYIDDIDIGQIRLEDLRKRISIIPQMPWLFKGSLRENLDPDGIRSDAELWAALHHAHLAEWVQKSELKLETQIVERGANMSQGQRQLLCIARALVRRSKVVMMDEATANIDHATDALIQETIRKNFDHCTTLTIAHRLTTIANSDRILVLSHGRVVECASPHQLLQNDESEVGFAALVRELAPESMDVIAEIAADTEQRRSVRLHAAMQ